MEGITIFAVIPSFYLLTTRQHTNTMRNKHFLLLPLVFIFSFITAEAQMNTDNSYLRKNYLQSKTAKKAAAKKARKKELKQIRLASKKKATDSINSSTNPTLRDCAYLKGKIPTTAEGVVCFEHTFCSKTKTTQQIFDILKKEALQKIDYTKDLDISRILSESKDTLIATICEPMYFKKKKWEADSALFQYQYFVKQNKNSVTLRIWFISYCYEQDRSYGFNYKAEEWITDKYALSKDGLSLLKLPGKFRRKTIDYTNSLFNDLETKTQ